jgi:licheninase
MSKVKKQHFVPQFYLSQWAIENNVPIICNEFGSYSRTAQEEDRLNYYRDITKAFEALQIPWQHWGLDKGFNLVDPTTGEPLPGMLEALGLQ